MTYLGLIRFILILIFAFILLDEMVYKAWRKRNPGAQWSHLRGVKGPMVDPNYKHTTIVTEEERVSRRLHSILDQ